MVVGDIVIFLSQYGMCSTMIVTYVVNITSNRALLHSIPDHNVYHGHRLADGKTYFTQMSFHSLKCSVQLCTENQVLF